MMMPVRCFSCGKPLAHLWEQYKERIDKGEDPKKVLDELGVKNFCCRAMFVGNVELIEQVGKFKR